MNRIAIAIVASLLAGFALGAWVIGDDEVVRGIAATDTGADDGVSERLARLEQIIVEEREARIALEDTIAMLFEDIERIEGSGAIGATEVRARTQRETSTDTTSRSARTDDEDWRRNYHERRVARLVDGGFSDAEARRVLELVSEAAYKALEAAWEAQRDGEAIDRLSSDYDPSAIMRSEMGDDAYARYLEAQGQPTAVRITQVLGGSPASRIGLQPGDELVGYDGNRVFTVNELRQHSMRGNPGEDVVIEIERDGTRIQLTVPRGPIGITGSGANVRASNWWGG